MASPNVKALHMASPKVKALLNKIKPSAAGAGGVGGTRQSTSARANPAQILLNDTVLTKGGAGHWRKQLTPRQLFDAPSVTTGETVGSRGYSVQKAIRLARDPSYSDQAKLECHVDSLMTSLYQKDFGDRNPNSVMMPLGMELMPDEIQQDQKYREIKALVMEGTKVGAEPEEVTFLKKKFYGTKAQSWLDTFAAASLIGAPIMGELLDLLRNKMAFGQAQMTSMPPQGIKFPKWLSDPTSNWTAQNEQIANSSFETGEQTFLPKKLITITTFPNELVIYGSPSVDAMVRNSLMQSISLSMDAGGLYGNGGNDQPLGIFTAAAQQAAGTENWGLNLIYFNSQNQSGGSNLFADYPQGLMQFPADVESNNAVMDHWIGRPDFWWFIMMQRWSSIAANDQQGGFLWSLIREAHDGFPNQLLGMEYNKTNQIQRTNNPNPTNGGIYLTDLIGLEIKKFWVGMLGAVEILSSIEAGEAFYADQTVIRAKLIGNLGPLYWNTISLALNLEYY